MDLVVRWRSTLVNGVDCLLVSKDVPKNCIIVCRQLEYRSFAIFNPYSTFIKYSFLTGYSFRCFYEVILGHQSQKPYFDIDISLKEDSSWTLEKSETLIKDLCLKIMTVFKQIIPEDIMIFSSHGKDKISYHVVVDRWCFPDFESNKFFCNKIIDEVENADVIDRCVYKSLQQFRTFTSSKYGSDRRKGLSNISTWKSKYVSEFNIDNPREFYTLSQSSFITATSYCKILGYQIPDKIIRDFKSEDLTLEQIEIIKTLDIIKDKIFDIGDVKGRLITLKRLRSSFCDLCSRNHENEHPFLTVTEDGNLWFHCRRSSGKTFLKNINPLFVNIEETKVISSKINIYKTLNDPKIPESKIKYRFDLKKSGTTIEKSKDHRFRLLL